MQQSSEGAYISDHGQTSVYGRKEDCVGEDGLWSLVDCDGGLTVHCDMPYQHAARMQILSLDE